MSQGKFKIGDMLFMTEKFIEDNGIPIPFQHHPVKVTDIYNDGRKKVIQLNSYTDPFTISGAFEYDGNFTSISPHQQEELQNMYKPNEKFIVKEEIGLMKYPSFEQWTILEGAILEIVRVSGEFIYFESQAKEQFSLHHKLFKAHTEPYVEPSTKRYSKVTSENLDFSDAMHHLSAGHKVTRSIWDGYWKEQLIFTATDGDMVSKKAIVAYLKGGGWAVASPYQEDMLAKDWMVVS